MFRRRKSIKREEIYITEIVEKLPENVKLHFKSQAMWRYENAELYRQKHYRYRHFQIFLSFLIVALGALQTGLEILPGKFFGIIVSIGGGVSAFLYSLTSFHQYRENWKRYRISLEEMESLARNYLSRNFPFNTGDDAKNEKKFMYELNAIITSELSKWERMCSSESENGPIGINPSTEKESEAE